MESVESPVPLSLLRAKTLQAPNAMGLCPVCWWEDDGQEDADASEVRLTVNGQLSLAEARNYYAQDRRRPPPVFALRAQSAGH